LTSRCFWLLLDLSSEVELHRLPDLFRGFKRRGNSVLLHLENMQKAIEIVTIIS
jgi:hypothetical protein